LPGLWLNRKVIMPNKTKLRDGGGGYLKHLRYRGVVIVWAVLLLFLLILIVGLSVDTAKVVLASHQLQNAADAAALAGAQVVKYNQASAIARAIALAGANYADKLPVAVAYTTNDDPAGEVVLGRWVLQLRQFFPTTISPNAVRVRAKRIGLRPDAPKVSLIFGPIAGVDNANASQYATGVSLGSTGAGIICLAADPRPLPGWNHATGLLMDGGTILDLRGFDPVTGEPTMGDIQVNSTSTESPWAGFRLNGSSADIYAGEFNLVGSANPRWDDTSAWQSLYGDPSLPFSVSPPGASHMDDPLAGLTPPDIATIPIGEDENGKTYPNPSDTITGGNLTLKPGYYPGGINTSGGSIVLNPGVYAFGGGTDGKSGMVFTGGSSLVGNGVMCYVTIGIPGKTKTYGQISMQGTGTLNLTSRGDAMTPAEINGEMGVAIWQDRDNPSYGSINGTTGSVIKGVIYCGYNAMKITGTPNQMGSQLIVGALEIGGNISLGIAYDGRNIIESSQSYLVE